MPDEFVYVPGGAFARSNPPPVSRERGERSETNWKLIAAQLKAAPGVWHHVAAGSHALAQYPRIKAGSTDNWAPMGSFEAVTRVIANKTHVWARYVGPPLEAVEQQDGRDRADDVRPQPNG